MAGGGWRLPGSAADVTVKEVAAAYWTHAQDYYRKGDGEFTSMRLALARVRRLYGEAPALAFGSLALKAMRAAMVVGGCAATTSTPESRGSAGCSSGRWNKRWSPRPLGTRSRR